MPNTQLEAYRRQYTDTLTHLFDADKKFLQDAVTVDTDINGSTKVFPFIGQLTGQRKTGRNEITILTEPDYSARHLRIYTDYVATPVDMDDVIRMVDDPKADIYWEAKNALHDLRTQEIMRTFFGDVITGEAGGSTTQFPAGNIIPVNYSGGKFGQNSGAANIGLNMDKLLRVRSLISRNKIRVNTGSENALHIAVTEDDVQDLMANKIGTLSDNFPLVDERLGQLTASFGKAADSINDAMFYWHGFWFHVIPTAYFDTEGSGNRKLPVWVKDGVVFGIKKDVDAKIQERPDMVETTEIKVLTKHGGMRKMDSKVYQILVTPTA